ncbi:MAG: NUDIX hydrolase [Candidatus Promineifilaceae bacterium]
MSENHSRTFIAKSWLLGLFTGILAGVSRGRLPPIPGVAAIVVQDDKLLLVERSDGMGFALPGGVMRWNESIEESVRREAREETGYNVEVLGPFKNYSGPERDGRFSSLCLAYKARVIDGRLTSSGEGIPHWIPLSDVLDLELAFDVRELVTDYFSQR